MTTTLVLKEGDAVYRVLKRYEDGYDDGAGND
jgi:hypothetical protein